MSDAQADAAKGPSKKELNKLARKEGKKNNAGPKEDNAKYSILFSKSCSPDLTRAVEIYLGELGVVKYFINKNAAEGAHLPVLKSIETSDATPGSIQGDANCARFLAQSTSGGALCGGSDAWAANQINGWVDQFQLSMYSASTKAALVTLLNAHLADCTYLVGSTLTLADLAVWTALRKNAFVVAFDAVPHVSRWFELISSSLAYTPAPVSVAAPAAASAAAAGSASASTSSGAGKKAAGKGAAASAKETPGAAAAGEGEGEGEEAGALGGCPPLVDAVEGQVCTRFPPEPSGYLHIGRFLFFTFSLLL
jgi:hypothetical protein